MNQLERAQTITWLLLLIPFLSLTAQSQSTDKDTTYNNYIKEAWEVVSSSGFADSLQNRYAEEFFFYYKGNRPSETADNALASAFTMWGNTGDDTYMEEALSIIPNNSQVWRKIIIPIANIYHRNEHLKFEDYILFLHRLEDTLADPKSKSEVYARLARYYKDNGNLDRVVDYARKLVKLNADEWYVDHGLGYLYEMKSLRVGQKAPDFKFTTIQGEAIALSDYKGKIVILDFWATWCGPCLPEIPHLKSIYVRHPRSELQIIGISLDDKPEKLMQFVKQKNINWPQILQPKGWDDSLTTKYNVAGIPRTYIIGRNGEIVAKDLRGEKLEQRIADLLGE
jgi:peroxiredoxin